MSGNITTTTFPTGQVGMATYDSDADARIRAANNQLRGIPVPGASFDPNSLVPPIVYRGFGAGYNNNMDPARIKYYDPAKDSWFMYDIPNGTVDRSFWRIFKPNFWFSRLVRSREHHCRKCCSYRDYFLSSKYKDDSRFDNFQCVKSSCTEIPSAASCNIGGPARFNNYSPVMMMMPPQQGQIPQANVTY